MDVNASVKITSWKAEEGGLEILISIGPWSKSAKYHRTKRLAAGSMISQWKWVEGEARSGNNGVWVVEGVSDILDSLVLDDGVLSKFCSAYGIE